MQEFIISGLYLYETYRLLGIMKKNNTRRTIWELFVINVFIVLLDIGLLAVEYLDLLVYEQTFKGVVYSIKLKLEFAILGKLVKVVRSGNRVVSNRAANEEVPDFVDVTRRNPSDTTYPETRRAENFEGYGSRPGHRSLDHMQVRHPWAGAKSDEVLTQHLEKQFREC